MKLAFIATIFAMLASMSAYAKSDLPLFQNDPCDNWAVRADSLFNSKQSADVKYEFAEARFQSDPCKGWWSTTQSLFN